ncbi:hypothetical protein Y1Q_0008575 [Alligator mississippiensis]|uniref:Uncharacterized protein n=1 Tax=Alligator mississippiensis TaxID=8496 RepID=A0A151NRF1_ALLMI|nr:hypothetical protein Y1Q_0008575 [Alligator mississippiensis]
MVGKDIAVGLKSNLRNDHFPQNPDQSMGNGHNGLCPGPVTRAKALDLRGMIISRKIQLIPWVQGEGTGSQRGMIVSCKIQIDPWVLCNNLINGHVVDMMGLDLTPGGRHCISEVRVAAGAGYAQSSRGV